jgi:hypothetical protein
MLIYFLKWEKNMFLKLVICIAWGGHVQKGGGIYGIDAMDIIWRTESISERDGQTLESFF